MLDTGFPRADAENDFLRARRHQFLAALTNRLRGRPVDSGRLVPLDEIVGSLGWRGQRQLGLQTIRLDTIVRSRARTPIPLKSAVSEPCLQLSPDASIWDPSARR